MKIFEITMLVCFGASWPISIAKTLRTKTTKGKSWMFLVMIIVGYVCGVINKMLYQPDYVMWLWILNTIMVTTDLILYIIYSRPRGARQPSPGHSPAA